MARHVDGTLRSLASAFAIWAASNALSGKRWLVLSGWALAALSFASAGHAARAEPVALMAPLVYAHALALIFWAGALPGLILALHRADTAALFSRLAVPMVARLVLSAAVLAWRQIETVTALTSTAYCWVLLTKMALFACVLALATWHRLRLTPMPIAR